MPAVMPNHREELAAMVQELQTNRAVLDGLTNWYEVFVFTGGCVPTVQWDVAAMTSYLEHPAADDCLSTPDIERYRRLTQAIGALGQGGAGPRTLRCRHDLGNEFGQAASRMRLAADTLKSSLAQAILKC